MRDRMRRRVSVRVRGDVREGRVGRNEEMDMGWFVSEWVFSVSVCVRGM